VYAQVRARDVDSDVVAVRDEELALGAARANLDGRAVVHARVRQAARLVRVPGVDVLHDRRRRRWCGRDGGRAHSRSTSAPGCPDLVRVPGRALVRLRRARAVVQVQALVTACECDAVIGRKVPVLRREAGIAGVDLGRPVVVRIRAGVEATMRTIVSVHAREGAGNNAQVGTSELN
jgi:hypothetical protein